MTAQTTVVMVTYNSKALLPGILSQLEGCNILIVDNASTDGTQALLKQSYPHVHVIENSINQGYGRAINQALAVVETPFLMVVNPDLDINTTAIVALEQTALNQTADWLFIAPDTGEAPTFSNADAKPLATIKWASGCAMFFNVNKLKALNGFDNNIFLFYEETDLCLRAFKLNIPMLYADHIKTPHAIGESVAMNDKVRQLKEWHYHWSKLYYYKKHGFYSKLLPLLCKCLLVYPFKLWFTPRSKNKYVIYGARFLATKVFVLGGGAFDGNAKPRDVHQ